MQGSGNRQAALHTIQVTLSGLKKGTIDGLSNSVGTMPSDNVHAGRPELVGEREYLENQRGRKCPLLTCL